MPGYALVEEVITPMIIDRWIKPLENFENPLEGILFQMNKLMGEADPKNLKLGCPLNNLVQEMSPIDEGFKMRLQKALNLWIDELQKKIKQAQAEGYIKKDVNTYEVACFIVMSHEGFYGLMKGLENPNSFKILFHSLKLYFNQISTKSYT